MNRARWPTTGLGAVLALLLVVTAAQQRLLLSRLVSDLWYQSQHPSQDESCNVVKPKYINKDNDVEAVKVESFSPVLLNLWSLPVTLGAIRKKD